MESSETAAQEALVRHDEKTGLVLNWMYITMALDCIVLCRNKQYSFMRFTKRVILYFISNSLFQFLKHLIQNPGGKKH